MFMPTIHAHYIFFKVLLPQMLEEEDHQLEGGEGEEEEEEEEAEAEEEGLLHCSMCKTNHLGYVIISGCGDFILDAYVLGHV